MKETFKSQRPRLPTQNEKRDDRDYENNFETISTSNSTKANTRIKKSSRGKVNKQTRKIINQKVIINENENEARVSPRFVCC